MSEQRLLPGSIVSLDFDPFLYSQDPSERYVAGGITVKGDKVSG